MQLPTCAKENLPTCKFRNLRAAGTSKLFPGRSHIEYSIPRKNKIKHTDSRNISKPLA